MARKHEKRREQRKEKDLMKTEKNGVEKHQKDAEDKVASDAQGAGYMSGGRMRRRSPRERRRFVFPEQEESQLTRADQVVQSLASPEVREGVFDAYDIPIGEPSPWGGRSPRPGRYYDPLSRSVERRRRQGDLQEDEDMFERLRQAGYDAASMYIPRQSEYANLGLVPFQDLKELPPPVRAQRLPGLITFRDECTAMHQQHVEDLIRFSDEHQQPVEDLIRFSDEHQQPVEDLISLSDEDTPMQQLPVPESIYAEEIPYDDVPGRESDEELNEPDQRRRSESRSPLRSAMQTQLPSPREDGRGRPSSAMSGLRMSMSGGGIMGEAEPAYAEVFTQEEIDEAVMGGSLPAYGSSQGHNRLRSRKQEFEDRLALSVAGHLAKIQLPRVYPPKGFGERPEDAASKARRLHLERRVKERLGYLQQESRTPEAQARSQSQIRRLEQALRHRAIQDPKFDPRGRARPAYERHRSAAGRGDVCRLARERTQAARAAALTGPQATRLEMVDGVLKRSHRRLSSSAPATFLHSQVEGPTSGQRSAASRKEVLCQSESEASHIMRLSKAQASRSSSSVIDSFPSDAIDQSGSFRARPYSPSLTRPTVPGEERHFTRFATPSGLSASYSGTLDPFRAQPYTPSLMRPTVPGEERHLERFSSPSGRSASYSGMDGSFRARPYSPSLTRPTVPGEGRHLERFATPSGLSASYSGTLGPFTAQPYYQSMTRPTVAGEERHLERFPSTSASGLSQSFSDSFRARPYSPSLTRPTVPGEQRHLERFASPSGLSQSFSQISRPVPRDWHFPGTRDHIDRMRRQGPYAIAEERPQLTPLPEDWHYPGHSEHIERIRRRGSYVVPEQTPQNLRPIPAGWHFPGQTDHFDRMKRQGAYAVRTDPRQLTPIPAGWHFPGEGGHYDKFEKVKRTLKEVKQQDERFEKLVVGPRTPVYRTSDADPVERLVRKRMISLHRSATTEAQGKQISSLQEHVERLRRLPRGALDNATSLQPLADFPEMAPAEEESSGSNEEACEEIDESEDDRPRTNGQE